VNNSRIGYYSILGFDNSGIPELLFWNYSRIAILKSAQTPGGMVHPFVSGHPSKY
jgi:hypothetical protein